MTQQTGGKLFSRVPKPMRPMLQSVRPLVRKFGRHLRLLKLVARNTISVTHPKPIFILGNQKSGTTVITALLGIASGSTPTLDLTREVRLVTFKHVLTKSISFDQLIARNRYDFSQKIIKDATLTFFFDALQYRFPEARFVFITRDPRDNIRSILNRVDLPGDLKKLDHGALSHVDPGFMMVMNSEWCGVESSSHYIDRLAARWNAVIDVYLKHREKMLLFKYEDFKYDKANAIHDLATRLDLPIKKRLANEVNIQFQSKGNHTVSWEEFFGADNLARINNLCLSRMKMLGYMLEPGAG